MFDPMAFAKLGAAVQKRAAVVFYKGFNILARDSDMREACDDDQTLALGALSLTSDLLTGAVTLEHLEGETFRDMAFKRGQEKIAERAELQNKEARKSASKSKPCEVLLEAEPDDELTKYLQSEGFKRVGESTGRPVIYKGLGCAKALKALLRPEDRVVFQTVVTGTRHNDSSSETQPEADAEREEDTLPTGVAPYVIASVNVPQDANFQDASIDCLRDVIVRIAEVESPLSQAILQKRLRRSYGLGSVRPVHESKIDTAIQMAIDEGHLVRSEDGFLLLNAMNHVVPRYRTGKDEDVRATSNISLIEIRAAINLQMRSDPVRDQAAIVIRTAALLGFALKTEQTNRPLPDKIRAEVVAALRESAGDKLSPL